MCCTVCRFKSPAACAEAARGLNGRHLYSEEPAPGFPPAPRRALLAPRATAARQHGWLEAEVDAACLMRLDARTWTALGPRVRHAVVECRERFGRVEVVVEERGAGQAGGDRGGRGEDNAGGAATQTAGAVGGVLIKIRGSDEVSSSSGVHHPYITYKCYTSVVLLKLISLCLNGQVLICVSSIQRAVSSC